MNRLFAMLLALCLLWGTALAEPVDLNGVEIAVDTEAVSEEADVEVLLNEAEIPVPPTSISLGEAFTMDKGTSMQLVPVTEPQDAVATYKWSVNKKGKKYVKIDKDGTLSAKKPGKATITVKTGKLSAKVNVTVVDPKVPTKVEILSEDEEDTVYVGETMQLTAVITPETAAGAKVTWSVNKKGKKYVSVSKTGVVKGKKEGKAIITAKAGKKKATFKVNVIDDSGHESVPTGPFIELTDLLGTNILEAIDKEGGLRRNLDDTGTRKNYRSKNDYVLSVVYGKDGDPSSEIINALSHPTSKYSIEDIVPMHLLSYAMKHLENDLGYQQVTTYNWSKHTFFKYVTISGIEYRQTVNVWSEGSESKKDARVSNVDLTLLPVKGEKPVIVPPQKPALTDLKELLEGSWDEAVTKAGGTPEDAYWSDYWQYYCFDSPYGFRLIRYAPKGRKGKYDDMVEGIEVKTSDYPLHGVSIGDSRDKAKQAGDAVGLTLDHQEDERISYYESYEESGSAYYDSFIIEFKDGKARSIGRYRRKSYDLEPEEPEEPEDPKDKPELNFAAELSDYLGRDLEEVVREIGGRTVEIFEFESDLSYTSQYYKISLNVNNASLSPKSRYYGKINEITASKAGHSICGIAIGDTAEKAKQTATARGFELDYEDVQSGKGNLYFSMMLDEGDESLEESLNVSVTNGVVTGIRVSIC